MDGAQLGAALLDFGSTYRFYGKGPDYRILSEDSRTVPDFILPALTPRSLGDPSFCAELGLSAPIVCGSMANGISSVELVREMARRGILSFFGSAGLELPAIEHAIRQLKELDGPFGMNLLIGICFFSVAVECQAH